MQLKDTGNRTDLGGYGGLRDINPENGRCDLLPASALCQYLSIMPEYNNPDLVRQPALVRALHSIFEFMDFGSIESLHQAIYALLIRNWYSKEGVEQVNVPVDVILAQGILDLSMHYKKGAEKYAERNWERGIPLHSFIDSAVRHLCKEILGWTDEPHVVACMWNLFGAVWTLQHYPELNDMPKREDYNKKEYNDEVKKEDSRVKKDNSKEDSAREANNDEKTSLKDPCDL